MHGWKGWDVKLILFPWCPPRRILPAPIISIPKPVINREIHEPRHSCFPFSSHQTFLPLCGNTQRESMALTALVHTGSIQPDSPDGAALADMAAHGDAGYFLDRVVSPIFAFLAVHVDRMGTDGVEIAHRIAYDDVNESLCRRNIVAQVRLLGWGGGGAVRSADWSMGGRRV